jgi:hypothetical protein
MKESLFAANQRIKELERANAALTQELEALRGPSPTTPTPIGVAAEAQPNPPIAAEDMPAVSTPAQSDAMDTDAPAENSPAVPAAE